MQARVPEIGSPLVSRDEILEGLRDFAEVYELRPIKENEGGMRIPHMYATWSILKKIRPDLVIESGVFKGQGTWLIERSCPEADIICFEPFLDRIVYRSPHAVYMDTDFLDYGRYLGERHAVAVFDDHQDALPRIKHCGWLGVKEMIFDDNYPASRGDNYSIKKMYSGAGFDRKNRLELYRHNDRFSREVRKLFRAVKRNPFEKETDRPIAANDADWQSLQRHIECYFEFPPIVRTTNTRWGDDWDDECYPTLEPVLSEHDYRQDLAAYYSEAQAYTWICYLRLK